jgi:uncharacterized damage-inducible protein DinB
MKRLAPFAALVLILAASSFPLPARADGDATPAMTGSSPELTAAVMQIKAAEDKLVDLANATPQARLMWRPGKGVRSTGEVFLHVASGNYFLSTFLGAGVPEGVDMKNFEQSTTDKAKIIDAMKASFAHAEKVVASLPAADLDKPVTLFGTPSTERDALLILVTHVHEHLGQSIAYARSNGIVPPWTARSEAEAAAAAKAKAGSAK